MEENNLDKKVFEDSFKVDELPVSYSKKGSPVKMTIAILVAIVLLIGIGGAYAYIKKIGPFAGIPPYTEKNLLSGILSSLTKIKSSSYNASVSFSMDKRDADAEPFATKLSNADEIQAQYENDYTRSKDISNILSELNFQMRSKKYYSTSLQSLLVTASKYYKMSILDPKTQEPYNFVLTENGKNFSLSVTFETNSAISAIKKYDSYSKVKDATTFNGKTVTFTKDSYSYFYLSSTPPKPALVKMADYLTYLPSEMTASGAVSAQADWAKDSSEWKFNVNAQGDFGDLTYKANIDALRKDKVYYFRINNLPSMFFGYIGLEKGQWVKIDTNKDLSGSSYNYFANLPQEEKYFKENKQEFYDLMKKVIKIADDQGLISLKHPVYTEKVNGQNYYRYDIQIRKEAILPFYKVLQEEVSKTNLKNRYPITLDNGYVEYLQSPEFNEMFDYYQKNTNLSILVDSNGFPAVVSYNIRIVPGSSAPQLKDKQGNLTLKLELSDINKSVNIIAPGDAKDAEDIMKLNPYYQKNTDASIKANMSTILTSAAIYYDSNGNYNNWCNKKDYTNIKDGIDKAYGNGSSVVCSCDTVNCNYPKNWCVSALLVNKNYYCVDSQGIKKESTHSNVCSNGICGK